LEAICCKRRAIKAVFLIPPLSCENITLTILRDSFICMANFNRVLSLLLSGERLGPGLVEFVAIGLIKRRFLKA
jgi:hypothetical protein